MHDGFYKAWQALERDVVTTITTYLRQAPGSKIYVLGHSLGAALASVAALRLHRGGVLPSSADVAGVWLLAAPRAGNGAWRDAYNAALLTGTLRMSNFRDFAARLPQQTQDCSSGGLTTMLTERGQYAHVGRSLVMCPAASGGLVQWNVYSSGSEQLNCGDGKDGPDTSGATHMLGAYFDAWRRGYLASKGSDLAGDARTAAVLCQECTDGRLLKNMRLTRLDPGLVSAFVITC
jgi:pimeloyl-ACP methyl ester carboxylesterase